jgi:hypothetical protein
MLTLEFSSYINRYVTVEALINDCNAGGHMGYMYFDAQCRTMDLHVNQYTLPIDSIGNFLICESSATLTAPLGLGSYSWAGPGGLTSTTSVMNTSVSGIYTLQMTVPFFNCAPVTKTISLTLSNTTHVINSSDSLLCQGESGILTALGMFNCVWNTGDMTPSIFIAPDSTHTYIVTGTNIDGCPVSATYVQHVDACAGIGENAMDQAVALFPNPNSGEFSIKLNRDVDKSVLQVKNMLGQEVHRQELSRSNNKVKLKDPSKGLYYYSVFSNKQVIAKGKFKIE